MKEIVLLTIILLTFQMLGVTQNTKSEYFTLSFPFVPESGEKSKLYVYSYAKKGVPDTIKAEYTYRKKLSNSELSEIKSLKAIKTKDFSHQRYKDYYEIRVSETDLPDSSLIYIKTTLIYKENQIERLDSIVTSGFTPGNVIPIRYGDEAPENNYDIILIPDERLTVEGGEKNDYKALRSFYSHNIIRTILLADPIVFENCDQFNFYISKKTGLAMDVDSFYSSGSTHIIPPVLELKPELYYIIHKEHALRDYYFNGIASTDDFTDYTIVHEFSHAFFFLQDEYEDTGYDCCLKLPNVFKREEQAIHCRDSLGFKNCEVTTVRLHTNINDSLIYNNYYKLCPSNCYMNKRGKNQFGAICQHIIKTIFDRPTEFKMN